LRSRATWVETAVAVLRHVRASSVDELMGLWDWLGDAEYAPDDVRWVQGERKVVVPFTNYSKGEPDFPPPKPDGEGLLSDFFLYPWFRATLTVHGVRAMHPPPEEFTEFGLLQDVEWLPDESVVSVSSMLDGASFRVEADAFDVEVAVTDEIDHWRRHSVGRYIKWEGHGGKVPGPDPGP
jgi:hypothetical protein